MTTGLNTLLAARDRSAFHHPSRTAVRKVPMTRRGDAHTSLMRLLEVGVAALAVLTAVVSSVAALSPPEVTGRARPVPVVVPPTPEELFDACSWKRRGVTLGPSLERSDGTVAIVVVSERSSTLCQAKDPTNVFMVSGGNGVNPAQDPPLTFGPSPLCSLDGTECMGWGQVSSAVASVHVKALDGTVVATAAVAAGAFVVNVFDQPPADEHVVQALDASGGVLSEDTW
ncbi:hypothetical protein AB0H12_34740 [Actinosynnema sp. NPDC023794]